MRRDAKTTCYLPVCRIHVFECKFNEFDAREWPDLDTQGKTKVKVEERYYPLLHYNQKEFQEKRSDLQVARHYSSAMKFNLSELKNPIVNIVISSGWRLKPLLFFSRILGG